MFLLLFTKASCGSINGQQRMRRKATKHERIILLIDVATFISLLHRHKIADMRDAPVKPFEIFLVECGIVTR